MTPHLGSWRPAPDSEGTANSAGPARVSKNEPEEEALHA